jgi:hypothetical protein
LQRQQQSLKANNSNSSEPCGDHGRSAKEESSSSSPQVATLRAENTRLREDAKAKDNWMQMAVEQFKGAAGEKEALQQRVVTLESSGGAEVDALLNEQRQQCQQEQPVAMQSLQQEHAVTIQSLQKQLQQQVAESNNAQMQRDELRDELDMAKQSTHAADVQSLQQEHAVAIQSLQEQLQQQVAKANNAQMQMDELRDELDTARSNHQQEREELELETLGGECQ